jgi:RimJ/RimL family protein N-acetyltransferase
MKVLETDRLLLRRLALEDAGFMLGLLNEASYMRFIGDKGVRTTNDARHYILTGPIASYEQFGFGLYLTALKDSGASIGICGLLKRDNLPNVDIGFAFLPQFWSQGYALEAASGVMAYGRETLGLKRIIAIVSPDNTRSIKLLGKLGFKFERITRWPADGSEIKLYASEAKKRGE